jgi:hypothetical protein
LGSYGSSSPIANNGSTPNVGAELVVVFAPAASATGQVTLFLLNSADSGAHYPDDGRGHRVATAYFAASATPIIVPGVVT